jgi:hypothetical protein
MVSLYANSRTTSCSVTLSEALLNRLYSNRNNSYCAFFRIVLILVVFHFPL